MFKSGIFPALAATIILGVASSAPARADVIYDLNFKGGGTGVLDLNLATLAAAYNLNGNIAPYFVSLKIQNVDGQSFSISSAQNNLGSNGNIQTGTAGQLYSLTVNELPPTGVPNGTDYISVYTSSASVYSTPYGSSVASVNFTINGPMVASAPEPSTWAMMLLGFCGLGYLAYRRKDRMALSAAA